MVTMVNFVLWVFFPQFKFVTIKKREKAALLEINQDFMINASIHKENKVNLNLHLYGIASKYIMQKLKELTGEIDKRTLLVTDKQN